jgi:outer membrane protein
MKIKFLIALFATVFMAGVSANAQLKVGYTNIDYLLSVHPDAKVIQDKLSTEKTQYDKLLQDKIAEFQKNYQEYQEKSASMSPVIRADKEKYLQNRQGEIQEFQQTSETTLQRKQQELLAPLLDKIQKAIDDVAKENGYTYVFNSDAGPGTTPIVLVAPDQDNISNLVFDKLGVARPAATPDK